MGGGLLPCMGRLDFGYRLGCDGMPPDSVIRCQKLPSEYLKLLHVDTMGFWAPHVREAIEVFGADHVMFGTDYGPVPLDPKEHIDIVNGLPVAPADKEKTFKQHDDAIAALQEKIKEAKAAASVAPAAAPPKTPAPVGKIATVASLPGIIVDDENTKRVGTWKHSTTVRSYIGVGYLHDENADKGKKTLTFIPELPKAGKYEIRLAYVPGTGRAANVPVTIFSADGEKLVRVDMRDTPPIVSFAAEWYAQ